MTEALGLTMVKGTRKAEMLKVEEESMTYDHQEGREGKRGRRRMLQWSARSVAKHSVPLPGAETPGTRIELVQCALDGKV